MTTKYIMILIFFLQLVLPCQLWAQEDHKAIIVEGEIRGSFDEAPENVQFALQALIAALRGEIRPDQFGPVIFEGDSLLRVRKAEGTFYAGFDVQSIQISYINKQAENTLQFIGRIIWEDLNQRRAATAFTLVFETRENFILIKDAKVTRMPPNMPRILVFLVEEDAVKEQLKVAKDGYLPLLELISKKSVRLDNPAALPKGKQDYMLFAFSLDRLARGERIDYIIGDGDPKTDIRPKEQKLINYSGWQVLVLATTFDLKEKQPPLYRVFYTPKDHPLLETKPHQAVAFKLEPKK